GRGPVREPAVLHRHPGPGDVEPAARGRSLRPVHPAGGHRLQGPRPHQPGRGPFRPVAALPVRARPVPVPGRGGAVQADRRADRGGMDLAGAVPARMTAAGPGPAAAALARLGTDRARTSGAWVKARRRYSPAPPASPLALSRRPGTTATPRLSAAWANALLSPPTRTHTVSPPRGSGQLHPGRADRSAPVSASWRARSHARRHATMSSCPSFSSAAVTACWKAALPRSAAALAAAVLAIRPGLALIHPVRSPPQ